MERISNYMGALCRTLVNVKKKNKKKNRQLASRKQLEIWRKTDHFSYVALSKQRNQAVFFFYLQKGSWKVCISRTVHLQECLLAESWLQWTQQEKTTKLT